MLQEWLQDLLQEGEPAQVSRPVPSLPSPVTVHFFLELQLLWSGICKAWRGWCLPCWEAVRPGRQGTVTESFWLEEAIKVLKSTNCQVTTNPRPSVWAAGKKTHPPDKKWLFSPNYHHQFLSYPAHFSANFLLLHSSCLRFSLHLSPQTVFFSPYMA